MMDFPLRNVHSEAFHFVSKSLADGVPPAAVLHQLTADFDRQSIFRMEQLFHGVCLLYRRTDDPAAKLGCQHFLARHADAELPLATQVECASLRVVRKTAILSVYPNVRAHILEQLKTLPEIIRFAQPPTAFSRTYVAELNLHQAIFSKIKTAGQEQLKDWLTQLLATEEAIDPEFWPARAALPDAEKDLAGFETYGRDGKHWRFAGLLREHSIGFEGEKNAAANHEHSPSA
jgi:hypothetical protein